MSDFSLPHYHQTHNTAGWWSGRLCEHKHMYCYMHLHIHSQENIPKKIKNNK